MSGGLDSVRKPRIYRRCAPDPQSAGGRNAPGGNNRGGGNRRADHDGRSAGRGSSECARAGAGICAGRGTERPSGQESDQHGRIRRGRRRGRIAAFRGGDATAGGADIAARGDLFPRRDASWDFAHRCRSSGRRGRTSGRRSLRRLNRSIARMGNHELDSLFSLRGRRGLVTGASSGLGVECAKALAIAGADVALVAWRKDRVMRIAAELAKTHGVKAIGIGADVTREDDLDRVMAETSAALGGVDILVNNAGVSPTGRAENFKREAWDEAIAVNLTAPMMLAQRVARRLIETGQPGRIINMVSIYASVASSVYRLSAYAATKAALANLTRQLAVEWAGYGILVNAIAPGWIPTEATEGGIAKPANKERMEAFTPMKRLGLAHEIRGAVIFLASPASSYVTGSVISVDGGYQAW